MKRISYLAIAFIFGMSFRPDSVSAISKSLARGKSPGKKSRPPKPVKSDDSIVVLNEIFRLQQEILRLVAVKGSKGLIAAFSAALEDKIIEAEGKGIDLSLEEKAQENLPQIFEDGQYIGSFEYEKTYRHTGKNPFTHFSPNGKRV